MFQDSLNKKFPHVCSFFKNAILKQRLANSYAIISKDSEEVIAIAKNISKIFNCINNLEEIKNAPCENCINCKWIENNQHPQAFKIIEPEEESKKEQIKIDSIRELLNELKTSSNYFRVLCFKKASFMTLTPECCNLLLKTVEESPNKTLFIFSSKSKDEILPTIISRSQILYLNLPNTMLLEENPTLNVNLKQNPFIQAKEIQKELSSSEIKVEDFLLSFAKHNYTELKKSNFTKIPKIYKKINQAYLKQKAFMQPKIVLEDLFLELNLK